MLSLKLHNQTSHINSQINKTMHDLHTYLIKVTSIKVHFPFFKRNHFFWQLFLSHPYKRSVKPCSCKKLVLWRSWINIMRRLSYFFMVSQFLTWQNKLFNWPLNYLSNKSMVFDFPYLCCLLTWFDLKCKFNMLDPLGCYFLNTSWPKSFQFDHKIKS